MWARFFLITSPVLAMMTITAVQIDPPKLHKTIVTHFSLDEICDLCFDLGLDSDELPPGGKSAKARGLAEMCQRRKRLVQLAEAVLEHRPNLVANEFLRDIANDDNTLRGHESIVWSVAFSPDGERLASGSADQTIQLWIFLEELVKIGCQKVRRNLSWEEWQRYLPGEPYRQTCPNLPPHPSVPAEELGG